MQKIELNMHPLYRFGLPIGNAIVLIGLLELANPLMSLVIDYGGVIANNLMLQQSGGIWEDIWLITLLLEIALALFIFWYGIILKGDRRFMQAWIGITGIFFVFFLIIEIVFFDWSFKRVAATLNSIYLILMYIFIVGYDMNFALRSLPLFGNVGVELEPIGKGWQFLVDYYKSHAKEAAALVLMFEIIFNGEIFLDRQMTRFAFGHEFMGHENDTNAAVLTEETAIRYIRIGLAIIGFYVAYKEKKYWMFRFCLCYMATIAVSMGIFIYLLFMWRSEHVLLTLSYFLMSSVNLLYRTGILYVCVRYTDVFERRGIPM